jgi:hypothetical protein
MDGWGGWILLGIVGYALAMLGVFVLFRVSSDADRNARRAEKELIPYSDVSITHWGNGD